MNTDFLKYYADARRIAQTNTILRLVCSGYTDGLFGSDVTCYVKNLETGNTSTLDSADAALDFLYTRNPQASIEIRVEHGSKSTVFHDPSEMWLYLKPFVALRTGDSFNERNWDTSQYSMLCSLNSETLSIANQLEFKACQQGALSHHKTAWEWLNAKKDAGEDIDALLLRISSFNGNPNHPFSKLRRKISSNAELTQDEVFKYFGEFGNTIAVPLYALSKRHADIRQSEMAESYEMQIAHGYPEAYAAWKQSLYKQHLDPANYVPVPVHPLNQEHLGNIFASWIESKDIVKTESAIDTIATISTRSMKPHGECAPYMKLTMPDIQITAVARKLGLSSICFCGPLTDLTKRVVDHDPQLSRYLNIVGEPSGIFFNPNKTVPYDNYDATMRAQGAGMSAIFRENPALFVGKDEIAVPLAGCFYGLGKDAETGRTEKPFLMDIMRTAGVHDAETAKAYFKDYAHKVIEAEVGLFLRYGVSLEAHQQNSYDIFDRKGHLVRRMIQDLADGAQIYRPVYEMDPERSDAVNRAVKGLSSLNYAFNLNPQIDEPLRQVIHTTFKCHLFPVAAVTAKEFGLTKTELMDVMRDEISTCIQSARQDFSKTLPASQKVPYQQFLNQTEKGLLHEPVLAKAFLTTLVAGNLSGYIDKMSQPNPFAEKSRAMAM